MVQGAAAQLDGEQGLGKGQKLCQGLFARQVEEAPDGDIKEAVTQLL